MAVRRAPTLAGTARTPCRARNAGQQPVRRDVHICRRLSTMPSQVPRKRCLLERRRSGWAACSKRHSPPCNRPVAKCGADRGELICERRAMRVCGTPGSARSIPPPRYLSRPGIALCGRAVVNVWRLEPQTPKGKAHRSSYRLPRGIEPTRRRGGNPCNNRACPVVSGHAH